MVNSNSDANYLAGLELALKTCAEERIHQIGKIQPVGVLLAVTPDDLVVQMASDNLGPTFGMSASEAIGQSLASVIGELQAKTIKDVIAQGNWPTSLICSIDIAHQGGRRQADVHVFPSDRLISIEIEMVSFGGGDEFHRQFVPIRDLLWKLDAEQDVQRYSQAVVDEVRLLNGYDRVMIYRFDAKWDGEVIAESLVDGAQSYMGNHFPASDIPPQARMLYTRNLVRLIADVQDTSVPILCNHSNADPLDLSQSWMRSMSPVHVQYLRNMGVQASLSISLVQNNRLWGLIACHHLTPKYVPLRSREIIDFIGRMVSLKLSNMENLQRGTLQDKIRELLHRLTESIRQTNDLDQVIRTYQKEFLGLVRADGAVVSIGGIWHKIGQTLSDQSLQQLLRSLPTTAATDVYCCDCLTDLIPLELGHDDDARGIMVAPLRPHMKDFVMWFRPVILRTLRWAGRPEKQIFRDDGGRLHISPRQSFETWLETYSDKSLAWSQVESDAANSLSLALIEVLAQKALQSSEASYRLLAENSTDLIARLNLAGELLFVSPASVNLFGLSPSIMQGHALNEWIVGGDKSKFSKVLNDLRSDGMPCTTLLRCKKTDGRLIWVEASCKQTQGKGGVEEIVVNARDVTQRHTYQLAIEEVHRRNNRIMEATGDGLLSLDTQGNIVYANEMMGQLMGVASSQLLGQHCSEILYSPMAIAQDRSACVFLESMGDGETRQGTLSLVDSGGEAGAAIYYICTPLLEAQTVVGAVVVFRKAVVTTEGSSGPSTDMILDQTVEGVMVTTASGVIVSINRAFTEITGFSPEEAIGQTPRLLRSGVHTPNFYQGFWEGLQTNQRWVGEIWNRRKNGEIYPQWGSVTAIVDSTGSAQNYVAVFSDISKSKQAEEKLYFLANHDALTGLPNRMQFMDKLGGAIERARRIESNVAILFIDVDRFKLVNDTLGHACGDIYLQAISARLQRICRKQDTLARWGGDEFVMALESAGDVNSISSTVTRLQQEVSEAIDLEGHQLVPTLSIGICIYPQDGALPSDLIKAADAAMYRAKYLGRNGFAFFTEVMSHEISEKFSVSSELHQAIVDGALCLHYQPQINAKDGSLVGVEALVRWQHPTRGLLPPSQFIPVAEELGLIEDVGNWVLQEAVSQMQQWKAEGVRVPRMAVNVAPAQLNDGFVQRVGDALQSAGLAPECLELEITEGALQAGESVKRVLEALRALHVMLTIDDFGTGYSSLSHVKNFPITCFKIDKSFVDGVPGNEQDVAIVKAILTLGSSLRVEVVAEGVETQAQYEFLKEAGAISIQGFYFARPMLAKTLAEFARNTTG
jgi:diguanylate cyclase (GGDEF)-like protein/PAS domain S-box-containing protein